jgi:hypothetical protein
MVKCVSTTLYFPLSTFCVVDRFDARELLINVALYLVTSLEWCLPPPAPAWLKSYCTELQCIATLGLLEEDVRVLLAASTQRWNGILDFIGQTVIFFAWLDI